MSGIIQELIVFVNGKEWYLFSVDYDTADGKFTTYIYALSLEHAFMLVEEMKQTARVGGQVLDVIR